jgi:hypothetical protein
MWRLEIAIKFQDTPDRHHKISLLSDSLRKQNGYSIWTLPAGHGEIHGGTVNPPKDQGTKRELNNNALKNKKFKIQIDNEIVRIRNTLLRCRQPF